MTCGRVAGQGLQGNRYQSATLNLDHPFGLLAPLGFEAGERGQRRSAARALSGGVEWQTEPIGTYRNVCRGSAT